nr:unnamed protein product [Callosobruchus chinensis]
MGDSSEVKVDAEEVSALELRLLELAKSNVEGISNDDIKEQIPDISLPDLTNVINKFLKNGTFELFKTKDKLYYKYKDPSKKTANKGADNEEKVVYKIIEEAGNKGIWIRDIRFKSNLNMTQLNKVLKSLETKKIIKAVKSVSASKKKVYMLYDLEPDSTVTGGAWYQDQDFESEFVDVLSQQCQRYLSEKWDEAVKKGGGPLLIRNRSYATANDVHKFISELGISNVALTVADIESILYTVVLDNNAERIVATNGSYLYKAVSRFLPSPGLVKTTCGICPVAHRCGDMGLINAKACTYFTEWLNQHLRKFCNFKKFLSAKAYIFDKQFDNFPKATDFKLVEEELGPIKDGEFLTEAVYLSVDPYMRAYAPRLKTGKTFLGSQVARNTAYFGFLELCQPKKGETVFVTGAAGAVGSLVGQIAKIKGCKVVGIAGSDEKGKWLTDELGFDHFINYKSDDLVEKIREYAPNGIDCYFDNVGGEISSKIMFNMNTFGRIAVCGAISGYNENKPPKATLVQYPITMNQLRMEGFIVHRWLDRWFEGIEQNRKWIREGKLKYRETVTHGFENMFNAFADMLKGANIGKALVKV